MGGGRGLEDYSLDGQITNRTARKCGGYLDMWGFNCFLLFCLDVQDVLIDVHEFSV